MTDLKNLLDEAAGSEPLLTDADLAADLTRGRRSVRRRRIAGVAAAATATAAAVGVAVSLAPSAAPASGLPAAGATEQAVTKTCGQLRTEYGLKATGVSAAHEMTSFDLWLPGFEAASAAKQPTGRINFLVSVWDLARFDENGQVKVPAPGKQGWSATAWSQVTKNCIDRSNGKASVQLVASGKPLAGAKIWCDLKPAGWTPVVLPRSAGEYHLGFRPPSGGTVKDMFIVSGDDQGSKGYESPGTLKWNSGTEHKLMNSCHKVQ